MIMMVMMMLVLLMMTSMMVSMVAELTEGGFEYFQSDHHNKFAIKLPAFISTLSFYEYLPFEYGTRQ